MAVEGQLDALPCNWKASTETNLPTQPRRGGANGDADLRAERHVASRPRRAENLLDLPSKGKLRGNGEGMG